MNVILRHDDHCRMNDDSTHGHAGAVRPPPFTLIEMLVVEGIVMILASMLLPALKHARQKAEEIKCKNNLKQLWTGCAYYSDDYNGCYPTLTNQASYFVPLTLHRLLCDPAYGGTYRLVPGWSRADGSAWRAA